MRVLMVGAGAVGMSYGWYLRRGGAELAFLVRPKYADEVRAGTQLYFPKRRGVREPTPFSEYDVLTSDAEVAARSWDLVFLCISATALRGPWLDPFLAALGPDTTVVLLTPGAEDHAYLAARFPAERIVAGLITLVAWQTPLPGEAPHPPGIAVWFPPLAKLPFRGPAARVEAVMRAMRAGGAPVKDAGRDIVAGGTVASAILTSHVAALEGAGWTFAGLRRSPLKAVAAGAAREGMAVLAALQGKRAPLSRTFVRASLVGAGLRLAAWRMPFDFEVYLRYHFTKVRDQTAFTLGELERLGRERGLPVERIAALRAQVFGAG